MKSVTTEQVMEASQAALPERISLSERDFIRFVEMIENSPPPTQKRREAMAEYQRLQAAHPESNL